MDLPFKAEYAKSGRASCRGCKSTIEKDTLRLAVMVQSPMFDGKTPHWYHHLCFFTKQRPKTVDDIAHFESLRWDDQENIRSKVGASTSIIVPEKKGKKRDAAAAAAKKSALGDFTLEYSKSSRATCRGCEQKIMKEEYFRLPMEWSNEAVLEFLDLYEQESVIWNPAHPLHKDRNENVDAWRRIQEKLGGQCSVLDLKKKKDSLMASFRALFNKVRQSITTGMGPEDIYKPNWFAYAKMEKFLKAVYQPRVPMNTEIRISKKDFETDVGKRYGGQDMWHHVTCFAKLRSELGYYECGDQLPGFKGLSKDDQKKVKQELPAIKQEDIPDKKPKLEDETDGGNDKFEKQMRSQNKLMFSYRDKLKALKKKELQLLLENNDQEIPVGEERMLDRLADIMTFGALEPCKECKEGQFVFDKLGYVCRGNLTEWSKCSAVTKEPKRRPFLVPDELAEKYSFLSKYKYVPRARLIKDANPTVAAPLVKKEEENGKPKVERERPPLYNMEFVIIGNVDGKKDEIKKRIVTFGGKVITKIKETVMAVISTAADVEKMGARIREAQEADIHVVPEEFLNEAKEYSGRIPELVIKKSICSWGADPHTRLPPEPSSSSSFKSKSGSMFTKSMPSKVKLKLKGGGAVDPDSGLEDRAHIYQSGKDKYTVVLSKTDIQQQKNSYYKLQLLQSDSGNRYWLFRSWGRIGTTIGGTKLEDMSLHEAKREFCHLYEEKSGNTWSNRDNFVKVPGRMYPIDVDYGDEEAELILNTDSDSKLPPSVQQLIQLIFDVNSMKKVMLEFELDTEKMPLGKLSKTQLQNAYGVLSELQQLVESDGSRARFIDASNRFYTFVPHSFGIDDPPIIDNIELIKQKIDMVENLMELEIAYSLMKSTGGNNTIDAHYDKLKTEIDILHREAEEFQIIEEYVKNTHAATHSNYELEIEDVFIVKRQGEEKRYKPFRKLHNRRLLWHGSRTTNYAGILSQGLRIAPPEAPVTGYMFGKGIYFADMVSKSANYCFTSPTDNTGLLMLCEVALGEMHELHHAKYIEKLPKGKHSVKGVGKTEPDPQHIKELPGGVHVPVGKGVDMDRPSATSLLYNEYIVYDVAQVNIKYLLKMNFKYKY